MRKILISCVSALLAGVLSGAGFGQSQPPIAGAGSKPSTSPASTQSDASSSTPQSETIAQPTALDQVIDNIIGREQDEVVLLSLYKPIIETYLQEMQPDKDLGVVPKKDFYFLGQADLSSGIVVRSMAAQKYHVTNLAANGGFVPQGFLQMIYVDRQRFDRKHYSFHYAGREFLGQVRCLMFDIAPLPKSGKNLFDGRIWVEDDKFTIVRFNGIYLPIQSGFLIAHVNLHFDSWRMNVQPGLWLPAYIFTEETSLRKNSIPPSFKGQTRFWGYNLNNVEHESEFMDLTIDSPKVVEDDAAQTEHDRSPLQEEREWGAEAEENVLDTLERTGLIAPAGSVDKVLDTVLNNLIVTNNLDLDPEPHCRVLLTSNLELFTIDHTIVISRGLIDVLPDEASLAVVLAQELADAMVPKASLDQYAFGDTLQASTQNAMGQFSFKDAPQDLTANSEKAMELLRNSPYRDKLGNAALFFAQLNIESKSLTSLISPHLGNRIYLPSQFLTSGTSLDPEQLHQIAALPMGARVKLDPWTDQVEMLKSKPVALESPREKMPFEVTPFMPFLVRFDDSNDSVSSGQATTATNDHQPPQPKE